MDGDGGLPAFSVLFILKSNLNIAPELIEKKLGLSVSTLDFISVLHKFLGRGL